MRLRNITGAREIIAKSEYVIREDEKLKGCWKNVFRNDNPIHVEVGMGKGKFITQLAQENPEINYVGIEKYSSVLLRAVEKREKIEIGNLYFMRMDAENITEYFGENEISKIYLNFSDPWPKDRHEKRRLTSRQFLNRYDKVLKSEGNIEFKTDNKMLFEFSMEEIPLAGWNLDAYTFDLHNEESMNKGNVMTEYEEKFSSMGNPIYKLIASR